MLQGAPPVIYPRLTDVKIVPVLHNLQKTLLQDQFHFFEVVTFSNFEVFLEVHLSSWSSQKGKMLDS